MCSLYKEYSQSKYLKPRGFEYIHENIKNFYVIKINVVLSASIELMYVLDNIIELGAFVVSHSIERTTKYMLAEALIAFAMEYAKIRNCTLISLTNNLKLQMLYKNQGMKQSGKNEFCFRTDESPGVSLFYK